MKNQGNVKRIKNWFADFAKDECRECQKTCCSTLNNEILIEKDEDALQLFSENGIPIYSKDSLKEGKRLIQPPALIETISGDSFLLYAKEYCPFFTDERTCSIHNDKRRPKACERYPITSINEIIFIDASCPVLTDTRLEHLRSLFPESQILVYRGSEKITDLSGNQYSLTDIQKILSAA